MDCKLGWLTPQGNLRERTLRLRQKVAISPEPGFWTHAVSLTAFRVFLLLTHAASGVAQGSKTPRQPTKSPSKGEESDSVMQEPSSDYHETSS